MKGIVVRILLILLFVFLLVWLFPMPNLNPFYDRIFGENVNLMKDAAKDYFTVERLPENEGDKVKITLEEMLEKKMILPFIDKDGNSCSVTESYVEVVKVGKEYMFKINLSCPTKTDYIIDYFGCYDICDRGCEKEEDTKEKEKLVLEYQFSRTSTRNIVDKYVCPTDYILDGKSCVKTTGSKTTKDASINCPSGYNYNNNNNMCEKSSTKTEDAVAKCSSGYTYNTSNKNCEKINTEIVSANRVCPTNYKYNTTTARCEYTTSKTENASANCSTGYSFNNTSKMCEKNAPIQKDAERNCPKGTYDSSSGLCKYSETLSNSNYTKTANYSGWVCTNKRHTSPKPATSSSTFSREYITVDIEYTSCGNTRCQQIIYIYKECSKSITSYSYKCKDSGYTYSGGKCTKKVTKTVAPTYSCPVGTINGKVCSIPNIDKVAPTYTCSNGSIPNQAVCNISVTLTSPVSYSCLSGYSLSGDKCSKKTTSALNPTYSCTNGKLNGSVCNISETLKNNPSYACDNGYTSVGNKCYKDTTIKDVKGATATYKSEKYTEYTWNRNKTLNGWVFTGKTRTVTVK